MGWILGTEINVLWVGWKDRVPRKIMHVSARKGKDFTDERVARFSFVTELSILIIQNNPLSISNNPLSILK